jgi:uncharacterized protein (UPF0179 family)
MMNEVKAKITLVGSRQAKEGFVFLHEGTLTECKECDYFKVCMMNLEPKRVYKIIEVREKLFPCNFHEDGARVVKVVETGQKVVIDRKYVFPQGIITYKPQECTENTCEHYLQCLPLGLEDGNKGKIIEVIGQIQCPHERSLVLVTLRRLSEAS